MRGGSTFRHKPGRHHPYSLGNVEGDLRQASRVDVVEPHALAAVENTAVSAHLCRLFGPGSLQLRSAVPLTGVASALSQLCHLMLPKEMSPKSESSKEGVHTFFIFLALFRFTLSARMGAGTGVGKARCMLCSPNK